MVDKIEHLTVADVATLLRGRYAYLSGMRDEDTLAVASGLSDLPASMMLSSKARSRITQCAVPYYPVAFLRTSPRRAMLLREHTRLMQQHNLSLFPEDCDLFTTLIPYNDSHSGEPLVAVRWDEMAWYLRERVYNLGRGLPDWVAKLDNLSTWWHFVQQVDGEPGMVSYIPSHDYGKRGRRVKVKLGRYLAKFYADALTEAQRKAIVDFETTGGIEFITAPDEMADAYRTGPHSCMAGAKFPMSTHPALAYGYPGEFKMAVSRNDDGTIVGRAMLHMPSKSFVRLYGPMGNKMEQALTRVHGFKRGDGYPLGTKFAHIHVEDIDTGRWKVRLPYIDGSRRWVALRVDDAGAPSHFELVEQPNSESERGERIFASVEHCTFVATVPTQHTCALCADTNAGPMGCAVLERHDDGTVVTGMVCYAHVVSGDYAEWEDDDGEPVYVPAAMCIRSVQGELIPQLQAFDIPRRWTDINGYAVLRSDLRVDAGGQQYPAIWQPNTDDEITVMPLRTYGGKAFDAVTSEWYVALSQANGVAGFYPSDAEACLAEGIEDDGATTLDGITGSIWPIRRLLQIDPAVLSAWLQQKEAEDNAWMRTATFSAGGMGVNARCMLHIIATLRSRLLSDNTVDEGESHELQSAA